MGKRRYRSSYNAASSSGSSIGLTSLLLSAGVIGIGIYGWRSGWFDQDGHHNDSGDVFGGIFNKDPYHVDPDQFRYPAFRVPDMEEVKTGLGGFALLPDYLEAGGLDVSRLPQTTIKISQSNAYETISTNTMPNLLAGGRQEIMLNLGTQYRQDPLYLEMYIREMLIQQGEQLTPTTTPTWFRSMTLKELLKSKGMDVTGIPNTNIRIYFQENNLERFSYNKENGKVWFDPDNVNDIDTIRILTSYAYDNITSDTVFPDWMLADETVQDYVIGREDIANEFLLLPEYQYANHRVTERENFNGDHDNSAAFFRHMGALGIIAMHPNKTKESQSYGLGLIEADQTLAHEIGHDHVDEFCHPETDEEKEQNGDKYEHNFCREGYAEQFAANRLEDVFDNEAQGLDLNKVMIDMRLKMWDRPNQGHNSVIAQVIIIQKRAAEAKGLSHETVPMPTQGEIGRANNATYKMLKRYGATTATLAETARRILQEKSAPELQVPYARLYIEQASQYEPLPHKKLNALKVRETMQQRWQRERPGMAFG